jgi:hypothetical protein
MPSLPPDPTETPQTDVDAPVEIGDAAHALLSGLGEAFVRAAEIAPPLVVSVLRAVERISASASESEAAQQTSCSPQTPVARAPKRPASIVFSREALVAMSGFARRSGAVVVLESGEPRAPGRADREPKPELPSWIATADVTRQLRCSKSKAHELLRAAAGRQVLTS